MTKAYCSACGSTQFLRHVAGCQNWQIPVLITMPEPADPDPPLGQPFAQDLEADDRAREAAC
jgi:hypothetical protein